MSEPKDPAVPEGQVVKEAVELRPLVLARIEDDPRVTIVPIGQRVPKVLRLWMNRDAVFFHAQTCVNSLRFMGTGPDAVFGMTMPVVVVRAGEEPIKEADGSRIVKPDMIVPDIEGKR